MMKKKSIALSIFIAFFVIGFAAGFVSNELLDKKQHKRRGGHKNWLVDHFTTELSLNEEQVKTLKNAMKITRQQHDSLNAEFEPHYDAIRNDFDQTFLKSLNDEQKTKYLKMKEDFENRIKKRKPPKPE